MCSSDLERNLLDLFERYTMGKEHAMHRAIRGHSHIVHDGVNRIPQEFECRDQGDIECAACELAAKIGRMIEDNRSRPIVN